jgi:hypothetical protein
MLTRKIESEQAKRKRNDDERGEASERDER